MTGWWQTSRGRRRVRPIAALLSAVVALALSCDRGASTGHSLQRHGLDVVSLMAEMVSSEVYRQLTVTPGELEELLALAGGGDYSQPTAIYQITFPRKSSLLDMMLPGNTDSLSQTLKDHLADRIQSALASRVNARSGARVLAAASLCSAGKTFVHPQLTVRTCYLYTFERGLPALVSFIPGEDGSVSASGSFIFSEGMTDGTSLQQLEGFAAGILEIQELAVEKR